MTKMPPVPPANTSPKVPGSDPNVKLQDEKLASTRDASKNLDEQDRQGNIKQNTTNQGYQQDR